MATTHHRIGTDRAGQGTAPRVGADMNVTPLIDILLVLLVIFMAALPMTQKGLDVDLPPVAAADGRPAVGQIVVEVTADRRIAINSQDVAGTDLESRLRSLFEQRSDKTLYVLGAGTLRYRDIVSVIDAARGAGVNRVGVITEGMRQAHRAGS